MTAWSRHLDRAPASDLTISSPWGHCCYLSCGPSTSVPPSLGHRSLSRQSSAAGCHVVIVGVCRPCTSATPAVIIACFTLPASLSSPCLSVCLTDCPRAAAATWRGSEGRVRGWRGYSKSSMEECFWGPSYSHCLLFLRWCLSVMPSHLSPSLCPSRSSSDWKYSRLQWW